MLLTQLADSPKPLLTLCSPALWSSGEKLQSLKLEDMPKHIVENYKIYKPWLDNV